MIRSTVLASGAKSRKVTSPFGRTWAKLSPSVAVGVNCAVLSEIMVPGWLQSQKRMLWWRRCGIIGSRPHSRDFATQKRSFFPSFKRWSTGPYGVLELAPSLSRPRPKIQPGVTSHGVRNVAAERLGHGSVRKATFLLAQQRCRDSRVHAAVDTRKEREDP